MRELLAGTSRRSGAEPVRVVGTSRAPTGEPLFTPGDTTLWPLSPIYVHRLLPCTGVLSRYKREGVAVSGGVTLHVACRELAEVRRGDRVCSREPCELHPLGATRLAPKRLIEPVRHPLLSPATRCSGAGYLSNALPKKGGANALRCNHVMQTPSDQPETNQATDRRVTVQEAASLLGISDDAVRSRLKRGTLRREKGRDGTVYVLLGSFGHTNRPTTNQPTRDQPTTEQSADQSTLSLMHAHLNSLQEQLNYLRDQLDQERGANRENRRIIAGLVNRIPELEAAPQDASPDERESPQSASEPRSDAQASQGYPEKEERPVSWWRRLFGT